MVCSKRLWVTEVWVVVFKTFHLSWLPWCLSRQRICLPYRRHRFDSESERSPGEGHSNLLQCSCLKNPIDRGDWLAKAQRVWYDLIWACAHTHTHTHTHTNVLWRKASCEHLREITPGRVHGKCKTLRQELAWSPLTTARRLVELEHCWEKGGNRGGNHGD